jgi:hypothetical protein
MGCTYPVNCHNISQSRLEEQFGKPSVMFDDRIWRYKSRILCSCWNTNKVKLFTDEIDGLHVWVVNEIPSLFDGSGR